MSVKTTFSVLWLVGFVLTAAAHAPEPNPASFTLDVNQWTKIAEVPEDPLGRELEPGQGAYFCYFPDSNLFYRYGGYTPTEGNELWSFRVSQRKWVLEKDFDQAWPPPSDRPGAGPWWSMAYDSKRKVIWCFGGTGVASQTHPELFNDIWKLDPATREFTRMESKNFNIGTAPIVYDSINDRIIRAPAYDGSSSDLHNRDKTWIYDPNTNTWEAKSTPGSPKHRLASVWVYAAGFGKCVYLERDTIPDSMGCELAKTWTYDYAANTWTLLNSTHNPPMRVLAAAVYDPAHKRVVIHGGVGGQPGKYGYAYRGGGVVLEDTWALDLTTGQWAPLNVGKPSIPDMKNADGTALRPRTTTEMGRLVFTQAAAYDSRNNVFVVTSPYYGVWALRYAPAGSALPNLNLPVLSALPAVRPPVQVYEKLPLNTKLLNLDENTWVRLEGGKSIGGGEVPLKFDPASGYLMKYGGCNNGGTTFASGYGNDLVAFDPASERWMAIRPVDPCGAIRPKNGCTRFYAGDPFNECMWFTGGTAGNQLAASIPLDWTGGSGVWRYVWKKDKFEYVPATGNNVAAAAGVVCGFDPVNKRFISVPKAYSGYVGSLNTETVNWTQPTSTLHAKTYSYGDFIDSLGVLGVIEQPGAFRTLNGVTGAWDTLPYPSGYLADKPPTLAYDPYNNIVLAVGNGQTFVYEVAKRTWTRMNTGAVPDPAGHLAFDRRHGVFISSYKFDYTYAYKYRDVAWLKTEAAVLPSGQALLGPASPNPFTHSVTFSLFPASAGDINLSVFDLNGRLIRTLVNKRIAADKQSVQWNGRTIEGKQAVSGVYLVRLKSRAGSFQRKVLLIQ